MILIDSGTVQTGIYFPIMEKTGNSLKNKNFPIMKQFVI